jgi:hypothetical protein
LHAVRKNLCGIAQLVVGCVTVCSTERTREFSGIAWASMDGWGYYKFKEEARFSEMIRDEIVDEEQKQKFRGLTL